MIVPVRLLRSKGDPGLRGIAASRPGKGSASGVLRASFLALALATSAAHGALFDDDEARKRIEATNQRLAQVQRQIEDRLAAIEQKAQGVVDLGNQLELLRADLAKLRGQIEVVSYELEQAQKRQRDLYVDLDSRLRKIETVPSAAGTPGGEGGAAPAPAAPPSAAPPLPPASANTARGAAPGAAGTIPPIATAAPGAASAPASAARTADATEEQRAYDAGLELFKRGDYAGAAGAFGRFVKTYPKSPLASSAQYWIGNANYARRDFRAAIAAQRSLVASYPDSPKVPDALLNIASAQSDLGDNASARKTLEELIAKHPQSEAAQKAKQRLGMR